MPALLALVLYLFCGGLYCGGLVGLAHAQIEPPPFVPPGGLRQAINDSYWPDRWGSNPTLELATDCALVGGGAGMLYLNQYQRACAQPHLILNDGRAVSFLNPNGLGSRVGACFGVGDGSLQRGFEMLARRNPDIGQIAMHCERNAWGPSSALGRSINEMIQKAPGLSTIRAYSCEAGYNIPTIMRGVEVPQGACVRVYFANGVIGKMGQVYPAIPEAVRGEGAYPASCAWTEVKVENVCGKTTYTYTQDRALMEKLYRSSSWNRGIQCLKTGITGYYGAKGFHYGAKELGFSEQFATNVAAPTGGILTPQAIFDFSARGTVIGGTLAMIANQANENWGGPGSCTADAQYTAQKMEEFRNRQPALGCASSISAREPTWAEWMTDWCSW
jgi:hypothetical protein